MEQPFWIIILSINILSASLFLTSKIRNEVLGSLCFPWPYNERDVTNDTLISETFANPEIRHQA